MEHEDEAIQVPDKVDNTNKRGLSRTLLGRVGNKDKVSFYGGNDYYVHVGESFTGWLFKKHEI
jgi:hypothetical protein